MLKFLKDLVKDPEPTDEEMAEFWANLPRYKVETVFGDRSLRKTIEGHANMGYEVVDITQKLAFGSNVGRTITFRLKS